jgi:hypothetical protein
VIEKEKVEMKILKNGNSFFFRINNREQDIKESGLDTIVSFLLERYNDPKNCISTNLKHKLVIKQINSLSNEKNENKNKKNCDRNFCFEK